MTMELSAIARIAAALVSALLIAFITTPVVKSLAQIVGAVDVPKDGRRMHDHPIPRMGGLAIFLGFLLSTLLFVPMSSSLRGMLLGGVIIVILGIFDDIYALPAKPKLVVQIVAALVAVLHGNVIQVSLSQPSAKLWSKHCARSERRQSVCLVTKAIWKHFIVRAQKRLRSWPIGPCGRSIKRWALPPADPALTCKRSVR